MTKTLEKEFAGVKLNKNRFQKLEKEILNEYHKTHEFTMPKQNNFPAVYDYGKIKEKFAVLPEISEDKIAEKLRKTTEYKKEHKKKKENKFFSGLKENLGSIIVAGAIAGVISLVSAVMINKDIVNEKFQKTYAESTIKYADTNNDKIIDAIEKNNFGYKILKDKKIILGETPFYDSLRSEAKFYPTWPEDEKGKKVYIGELTKWIEEYNEIK